MVNTGGNKLLRVGEISRRTGVSTSAINYYVREGLLPPPLKTAQNMAYYDPGYVDMINSIKVLQREKGLSLASIKGLLEQGDFKWTQEFPPEDFSGAAGTAAGSRRALDRRKHIMSVAAGVFAEKGYYATTIADLAGAAGVAKGTIYWYFTNKRSIMIAILEDIFREINETFADAIKGAPNGLEALLRCVGPALRLLEKHGPIYLMYFLEIGSTDPLIQEKFREIYRVVHTGTEAALVRGMKEGVIRDVNPSLTAYAVMGMIERISQVSGLKEDDATAGEKEVVAGEMLRHALAADRKPVKKAGSAKGKAAKGRRGGT